MWVYVYAYAYIYICIGIPLVSGFPSNIGSSFTAQIMFKMK